MGRVTMCVQGDQGGLLPGQDGAARAGAGGRAQGHPAAAGRAGLGHPHGHLGLHEPPAPAPQGAPAQEGHRRPSWGEPPPHSFPALHVSLPDATTGYSSAYLMW